MALSAQFAYIVLLLGSLAGAIQLHKDDVDKDEAEFEVECHTTREGETCYDFVKNVLARGLDKHPEDWPGLTKSSSIEEVQAAVFDDMRLMGKCPRPCPAEETCRTVVEGDACYEEVRVAMQHPFMYPMLTSDSVFEDFQAYLHSQERYRAKCPKPCPATTTLAPGECPPIGEACQRHIKWAMEKGVVEHPQWYKGLSATSTPFEFQAHLHSVEAYSGICPEPCKSKDMIAAEEAAWQAEQAALRAQKAAIAAEEKALKEPRLHLPKEDPIEEPPKWDPRDDNDAGLETADAKAPDAKAPDDEEEEEDLPPSFNGEEVLDHGALAPGADHSSMRLPRPVKPKARVSHGPPQKPQEGGCHRLLPSGCPNHPSYDKRHGYWVPDTNGELRDNEGKCLAQKVKLDLWCGVQNSRVMWNPADAPQVPTKKGCYVWLPGACPLKNVSVVTDRWRRDEWGANNAASSASEENCMKRKPNFDSFCGTKSARMLWKAEDTPTEYGGEASKFRKKKAPRLPSGSGCYFWLPSGCRLHKINKVNGHWLRDEWGEAHGCKDNTTRCIARKDGVNKYCGVNDAVMLRVGSDTHGPTGYSQLSQHRHNHEASEAFDIDIDEPDYNFERLQDMMAEAAEEDFMLPILAAPGQSPPAPSIVMAPMKLSQASKAADEENLTPPGQWWQIVAGDAEHGLEKGAAPPQERGCYVFMPSGCGSDFIKHGEWKAVKQRKEAKDHRKACSMHKDFYDLWCGVRDSVMVWVPGLQHRTDMSDGEKTLTNAPVVLPALPESPGCYVWYPSGCPGHKSMDPQTEWRRYHTSNEAEITVDEEWCLNVEPKQNHYCGTSDIKMAFVK